MSDTLILGGDDRREGETITAGNNGQAQTSANSGGNSFDQEAPVSLFHLLYAGTPTADSRAYIDWIVTNRAFNLPYGPALFAENVNSYMHGHAPEFPHSTGLFSLLGAARLSLDSVPGATSNPPHSAVAVGTHARQRLVGLANTNVHEIGHNLISGFEADDPFHLTHSTNFEQKCPFSRLDLPFSGLVNPICPRHASRLRDRVARVYGSSETQGSASLDSAPSR